MEDATERQRGCDREVRVLQRPSTLAERLDPCTNAATCLQWNSLRSSAGKTVKTRRRRDGLDIEMYSRLTVFREEQVESLANQPHADVLSIVTSEFRLENVELL